MNLTPAIILIISGVVALLLALVNPLKTSVITIGVIPHVTRYIMGIVGIALILGGGAFAVRDQTRQFVSNIPVIQSGSPTNQQTPPTVTLAARDSLPDPNALLDLIKSIQKDNVQEGCAIYDGGNFTEKMYQEFMKKNVPGAIKRSLKSDNHFIDIVLAVRGMRPSPRQELLKEALGLRRRTWTENGKIDCSGQTDAGRHAETRIADAVVSLVDSLVVLPEANILTLYK